MSTDANIGSSLKRKNILANSVDPDEVAHYVPVSSGSTLFAQVFGLDCQAERTKRIVHLGCVQLSKSVSQTILHLLHGYCKLTPPSGSYNHAHVNFLRQTLY